jgi:hypothetical protein
LMKSITPCITDVGAAQIKVQHQQVKCGF